MIRAILYEDNAQYDVLNIYLVRPFICFKLYSNSQKPFLLLLTSLNDFLLSGSFLVVNYP